MQIVIAILALSFLVVVHEFGHFIVAKLSGIKVHEFSLFMGPKLFSVKRGETTYSLRLIPLGGFVRMEGEEQSSEDSRAFNKKPIPVRMAVIAAGPIMNLLVAVILVASLFGYMGYDTNKIADVAPNSAAEKVGIQKGDRLVSFSDKKVYHPMDIEVFSYAQKDDTVKIGILRGGETKYYDVKPVRMWYSFGFLAKDDTNVVAEVTPGSPAEKGQLKVNDRIISLNGHTVANRQQVSDYNQANKEKPVKVIVQRNGNEVELEITPKGQKKPEFYALGVQFGTEKGGFFSTVKNSFTYIYAIIRSLYYSVVWLISGVVSLSELMGPIGIVTTIGTVVQQSPTLMISIMSLMSITAFISVNLGVFNLIPFPALDGSKLLILLIEAVRRKAIPPEKEARISLVGFALLIMLMIYATYNDIVRNFFQ